MLVLSVGSSVGLVFFSCFMQFCVCVSLIYIPGPSRHARRSLSGRLLQGTMGFLWESKWMNQWINFEERRGYWLIDHWLATTTRLLREKIQVRSFVRVAYRCDSPRKTFFCMNCMLSALAHITLASVILRISWSWSAKGKEGKKIRIRMTWGRS